MRIAMTEGRIARERARHQREDLDRHEKGLPGGHEVLWDTKVQGLGVRLRGESATYVVRGRHGGKPVWLSLGSLGSLGLEAARDAAKGHLSDWARKLDPSAMRKADREKAKRARFTLTDAWALYPRAPQDAADAGQAQEQQRGALSTAPRAGAREAPHPRAAHHEAHRRLVRQAGEAVADDRQPGPGSTQRGPQPLRRRSSRPGRKPMPQGGGPPRNLPRTTTHGVRAEGVLADAARDG